jgi:CHAT domain-containing protein
VTERHRPFSFFEAAWEVLWRAPRLGVSEAAAAVTSWWKVLARLAFVFAYLHVGFVGAAHDYQGWGLSSVQAMLLGGGMSLLGLGSLAIIWTQLVAGAYSRMRPTGWLPCMAAAPATLYLCAICNLALHVPLAWSLVIALASAAVALWYLRRVIAKIPAPVRAKIWLDDPTRAADLVGKCEEALDDPQLTDSERAAVQTNLASGLTAMALLSGSDDGLPRAYEILVGSLEEMGSLEAYTEAARLVDAMGAKATRTGDVEGYEDAVRFMLDAASAGGGQMRCVMARARLIHATHLAVLATRASSDGQAGRAARLHQEALDDLMGVFEHSSPRRTVHALARVKFASLVDRSGGGDLDAAIALCRSALHRLRLRSRFERDFARLALCELLTDRARLAGPRARRDLAEATRLCRRLCGRAASRAAAMRRLPTLLRLAAADPATIAVAYRDAFEELSLMSGDGASDLAAEWSAWALEFAAAPEAAQAHWSWLRAVADDARRRPLRAEKERRLARFLGMAAQTGECLIAAGRERDAAVALDLGRAMLLTERMSRDRDGIEERLVAAQRPDLADRWRATQERISTADRAAFSAGRATSRTMLIGGRRFQQRFTSPDHLALADLEQLLREIGRVPGCEDVDAPADYDDLREAAVEGPIVYLSATKRCTRAVIVTDAAQPLVITLTPTIHELSALARRLVQASDPGDVMDGLASTIALLWTDLMEPVAAELRPGSLVTLIPIGALSLLPLHVAGLMPGDDGVWHDRTAGLVFRYAPNARVLGRAQAQARALAGRSLRVLTVDVPDAAGEATLPWAAKESAGVVARFGTSRTQRPSPPSRAAVLRAMQTCGIWHFACHGIHSRADPLESGLVLSDGRLTLRAIFAQPSGLRRLAVLSACRTAAPDARLLDEVVSFPSALLQSGVAGVVCAQSDIADHAAMLLVLRFFEELERVDAPPRALARAQAWLRTATNEQIHAAHADAYPRPPGCSPGELAAWKEQREFTDPLCWAPLSYSGA